MPFCSSAGAVNIVRAGRPGTSPSSSTSNSGAARFLSLSERASNAGVPLSAGDRSRNASKKSSSTFSKLAPIQAAFAMATSTFLPVGDRHQAFGESMLGVVGKELREYCLCCGLLAETGEREKGSSSAAASSLQRLRMEPGVPKSSCAPGSTGWRPPRGLCWKDDDKPPGEKPGNCTGRCPSGTRAVRFATACSERLRCLARRLLQASCEVV